MVANGNKYLREQLSRIRDNVRTPRRLGQAESPLAFLNCCRTLPQVSQSQRVMETE